MNVIKVTKVAALSILARPVAPVVEIEFFTECFHLDEFGNTFEGKACPLCAGKNTIPGINENGMLRADKYTEGGDPRSETYFGVTVRNGGLDPLSARTEYLLTSPEISLPEKYHQYSIPGKPGVGKAVYQVVFKGNFARGEEATAAAFVSQQLRDRHKSVSDFPYTILTSSAGSSILISLEGMKHLYGENFSRAKVMKLEEYGRMSKLYKAELVSGDGKYKIAVIGEQDCLLNPYGIYKPGNGGCVLNGMAYYEEGKNRVDGVHFASRYYKGVTFKGTMRFITGQKYEANYKAAEKMFGFNFPALVNGFTTHEFVKTCSIPKTPIPGSRDSYTIEIDIRYVTPISIPKYLEFSGSANLGLTGAKYEFNGLNTWVRDMALNSPQMKKSLELVSKALEGDQEAMRTVINQGVGENTAHLRGVNMEVLAPKKDDNGNVIGCEFKLPNDTTSRFDIYQSVLSYIMKKLYLVEVDGTRNQLMVWDTVLDLWNHEYNNGKKNYSQFCICPDSIVEVSGERMHITEALDKGMHITGLKNPVPSTHNIFALECMKEKSYYAFAASDFTKAVIKKDDIIMLEGPSCTGIGSVIQIISCLADIDGDKITLMLSKVKKHSLAPVDWEKDETASVKKDVILDDDQRFMEWIANCNMTKVAAALAIGFGVKFSVRGTLIRLLLASKAGKKIDATEANKIQEGLGRIAELKIIKRIKSKLDDLKEYKHYTDAIDDNGERVGNECLIEALGLEYSDIWKSHVKNKSATYNAIFKQMSAYMNALSCRDGERTEYDNETGEDKVVPSAHPFDRIKVLLRNCKTVAKIYDEIKVTFPAMTVQTGLSDVILPRHRDQKVIRINAKDSVLFDYIIRNASDSQKQHWMLNRALDMFINKRNISEETQLKFKSLASTFVKEINDIYRSSNESYGVSDSFPKTQFIHEKLQTLIANCSAVASANPDKPWVFGVCIDEINSVLFSLYVGVECTQPRSTKATEHKDGSLFEGSRLPFNKCPGDGLKGALREYYLAFYSLTVSEFVGEVPLLDKDGEEIIVDDEVVTYYDNSPLSVKFNIEFPSWVNKFVFGKK
jgi:hypothetical protein